MTINGMQFVFTWPEKETTNDALILKRLQEKFHAKVEKLCMCFVDAREALDRVPRKVLKWAMGKKGIPEVLLIQ